ncbi:hypothetical protein JM84_0020 [Dokdonia sp. Hel_I_63]|uniref:nucleotidyltransferase domain-containing protein n=1 Tax=Dokdonia sp. Hel_I_63 TaxID=1249996 RepID=UPI00119B5C57|nr:nucleotidyltransferase domain-containing protein [Dokdonia sp. Hel_I_63]TVZ21153.1 hypothetical protein JM84_0020 [Dokdonia sp. Hel_I_63]
MELREIIADLRDVIKILESKIEKFDCLIFGSILTNSKVANDVDILIIYDNENHIEIIKQEFKNMAEIYPLHLNYFTFEEENELKFIHEQKARYISNL